MDITCLGSGKFGVGMLTDAKYAWNKDGSLFIKGGSRPLMVTSWRGIFLELLDNAGNVIQDGGDGDWFHIEPSKKGVTLRYKKLPDPKLTKSYIEKARRKTTVTVCDQEQYDGGAIDFGASYTNGSLLKVIGSFQKALASIPKEYRSKARCEINSKSGYEDSHYAHVEIAYERPETDAEVVARVKIEREADRISELKKRAQFDKLKRELNPEN